MERVGLEVVHQLGGGLLGVFFGQHDVRDQVVGCTAVFLISTAWVDLLVGNNADSFLVPRSLEVTSLLMAVDGLAALPPG